MLKKMLKMAAIKVPQVLISYGSPGFNSFIEKLLKGWVIKIEFGGN